MSLVGNFNSNADREDHRHQSRGRRASEPDRSSASVSSQDDQATLDEQRRISTDVTGLARTMSRRSQPGEADGGGGDADPLRPAEGSVFDPWSEKFEPQRWARAVYELSANDPKTGPRRTGGVAFENLPRTATPRERSTRPQSATPP